ncbi:MAG: hypothetical protein PHP92_05705 [Candidatus Nanoarchaeia archaeon]|nr:hypothetical protein [Candidatus Nanoarchaeia archaeon]
MKGDIYPRDDSNLVDKKLWENYYCCEKCGGEMPFGFDKWQDSLFHLGLCPSCENKVVDEIMTEIDHYFIG